MGRSLVPPFLYRSVAGLILSIGLTATSYAQQTKKAAPIAPLSTKAPEKLRTIARDLGTKPPEEVRKQLRLLPEAEQKSVDGVILWASVEFADEKGAQALERLGALTEAKDLSAAQLDAVVDSLLARKEGMTLARSLLERAKAKAPDDAMIDFRLGRCLIAEDKFDEGQVAIAASKAGLIKSGKRLPARLPLETIVKEDIVVDVEYNLGPNELKPPKTGIVRPYTFRVRKKSDKSGRTLEAVDFEVGVIEGSVLTAALGKSMPGGGHANFGVLPPDSKYSAIRAKFLDLLPRLVKS